MKKLTLKNEFHNREVTIHVPDSGILSKRQVKRSKKILCGIKGCKCSDFIGCRGWQDGKFTIQPNFDGTAVVEFWNL